MSISLLFALGGPSGLEVEKTFRTDRAKSTLVIAGTSTLHDWEMVAENFKGIMEVDVRSDAMDIHALKLSVPVESLKSGKTGMDNNAYKALKSDDHPNVEFELVEVKKCTPGERNCFDVQAVGKLTIAGQTRTITLPMKAIQSEGGMLLTGEKPLRMTDFGVEPPSFLMGAMTTGDDIVVKFSIQYI